MPRVKRLEDPILDPPPKSDAWHVQKALAYGIAQGRYWTCSCGLTVAAKKKCPGCGHTDGCSL